MPLFIEFVKYSGCGNDFVIIDNRMGFLVPTYSGIGISKLCHRHQGIGADGLILLENSATCDFRMRIFNADGSEAEMCGNGIRCLAKYIEQVVGKTTFSIETMCSAVHIAIKNSKVSVDMPLPTNIVVGQFLEVENRKMEIHHLDTGVPHSICMVEDLEDPIHMKIAPMIRSHPRFLPKGVNVNFALMISDKEIAVRTFERGVEAETLACGTGAVAVALVAAHLYGMRDAVNIRTRSGGVLEVFFHGEPLSPSYVCMTGPAQYIYKGVMDMELLLA